MGKPASPLVKRCQSCCIDIMCFLIWDFPGNSDGEESACKEGNPSLIHGSMKKAFFSKVYKPNLIRKCLIHAN